MKLQSKFYILLLFVLGIVTACNQRPKEILSDDKMEGIMVDLFLFEGTANVKDIAIGDTIKMKYYNQILKKHGVTLAQYNSSLLWYVRNTKSYINLNKKIFAKLSSLQKNIKKGKYIRPIAPNDSLDSTFIQVTKRDYFIFQGGPDKMAQFILKNKKIVNGDSLQVNFMLRIEGELKDLKAFSTIIVHYNDSTKDEKSISLNLNSNPKTNSLSIQADKRKNISYISVDLFKHKITLMPTQRVYIYGITMRRLFNPYRKAK